MQQLKCDQEHVEVVFIAKAMLIYIFYTMHMKHCCQLQRYANMGKNLNICVMKVETIHFL